MGDQSIKIQGTQHGTYCRDRQQLHRVSNGEAWQEEFRKRKKGWWTLPRSPFSFWNSLTVWYFCLPHLHTSKSSYIALNVVSSQHAPAKHCTFIVCLLCCPPPFLQNRRLSVQPRGWGVFWACFHRRTSWKIADTLQQTHTNTISWPTPCPRHLQLQYGQLGKCFKAPTPG